MNTHNSTNEYKKNENSNKTNGRRHTGTGVLIITNYFSEPYLLLGQESWKSLDYTKIAKHINLPIYEEFGGGLQTRKVSLEKNATFELREETANLINIKDSSILSTVPYFDIPFKKDRMYRLYILYLNNITEYLKYFYMNHNIISQNRQNGDKSNNYLEMSNLKLIPLKVINNKIHNPENYICFNSADNLHNNLMSSGYKGILKLDDDTFLNTRLVEFLNSKYSGVSGLSHCYNHYKQSAIKELFPNNNIKITKVKKLFKQNKEKYNFLNGTWCIDIFR